MEAEGRWTPVRERDAPREMVGVSLIDMDALMEGSEADTDADAPTDIVGD